MKKSAKLPCIDKNTNYRERAQLPASASPSKARQSLTDWCAWDYWHLDGKNNAINVRSQTFALEDVYNSGEDETPCHGEGTSIKYFRVKKFIKVFKSKDEIYKSVWRLMKASLYIKKEHNNTLMNHFNLYWFYFTDFHILLMILECKYNISDK